MCLAIPGKIIEITSATGLTRTARVDFEGVIREVNLACVPAAASGDYVLVHAGVAIGKLRAGEAERTLSLMRKMAGFAEEQGHEVSS